MIFMNDAELLSIIENTNAMLNRKGLDSDFLKSVGLTPIDIQGIKGYISPSNSPYVNHVGLARLDGTNVDDTILRTIDIFKKENKSFTWIVGPNTTPADLPEHLIKFGFRLADDVSEYGLVMSTKEKIKSYDTRIEVKDVKLDDLEKYVEVIASAFGNGMTTEAANTIVQMAKILNATERYKNKIKAYLAIDPQSGNEVGFSMMEMDTDDRYAILDGAGVLPSYRGRGIYRMMLSRRQEEARDNGLEYLIIHAVKNTSAPICEKIGFRKVCEINLYSYLVES